MSEQLTQTNALLNKYVSLLARSEKTAKLIFDERWNGADDVCSFSSHRNNSSSIFEFERMKLHTKLNGVKQRNANRERQRRKLAQRKKRGKGGSVKKLSGWLKRSENVWRQRNARSLQ